jgi:hypothetical protein
VEKTGVSACYECRRKGLPCYKYEGESKCITCGRAVCSHSHETHNGRDRRAVRAHLQAAYTFLETLVLAPNLETGRDHALGAIGKGADMFGGVHASTDDAVRQDLTENLAVRKQFEGRGLEGLKHVPAFRKFTRTSNKYKNALQDEARRKAKSRNGYDSDIEEIFPRGRVIGGGGGGGGGYRGVEIEENDEENPIVVYPQARSNIKTEPGRADHWEDW